MGVLQSSLISTITVPATAGGIVLAYSNPRRGALVVFNPPGGATVYVAIGSSVTTSLYSVALITTVTAGSEWRLPAESGSVYIGPVVAIVGTGTQAVQVTEVST